jgi:L-histidine Nalpha-methyltransferase
MGKTEIVIAPGKRLALSSCLPPAGSNETTKDIITGLTSLPPYIPSRFFYDKRGSALFEAITGLLEYYPTRTEKEILLNNASLITSDTENADIVELGSGDCSKISILFDAIPAERRQTISYIPVDVSRVAIIKSADSLSRKFPEVSIHGMVADFLKHLSNIPGESRRVICFFGSTIGNLDPVQTSHFLSNLGSLMQKDDQLLLGLDMVKDTMVLEIAYNDTMGVTAAFNRNILRVINKLIRANLDPDHFDHYAFYNSGESRIEMHLRAIREVKIESPYLPAGVILRKGETIHTENSYKFTETRIPELAVQAGLRVERIYTDDNRWFSVAHFRK